MRRPALLLGLLALLGLSLLGSASSASADVGYQDQAFTGTGTPTGIKRAESVLWWNDGSWWANMWDAGSRQFHIFRLDAGTQKWIDTGVPIDTRSNTHADVLWDGTHLYVASHAFVSDEQSAVSGTPSYLFRFSYNPATKTYSRDSGFPVTINNYKTETLVIDKDSTGKLWATWQQGNKIYMNRTTAGDQTWGTPFVLPTGGVDVTVDDISTVIAFGGSKIGVMWSNQSSSNDAMYFAVHEDGQPDGTWQASRTAIQGSESADDHMNLKSVQADSGGRIYAAVKTSFSSSANPLIMLLVRDPGSGDWTSHSIARVSDCPNRPIVVLDEENRVIHTYATYPGPPGYSCNSSGGAIYEKTSPMDAISFPTGSGTPVMLDSDSPFIHNVSSSKQNVNSRTGIALLAINGSTGRYWHSFASLAPAGPSGAPVADFTASPRTGTAPLSVNFSDASIGAPTSWLWDFGDGGSSTSSSPTHVYDAPGTYSVTLTVANERGGDTVAKTGYVTVSAPTSGFSLSAAPSTRTVVRGASTTYSVTANPLGGFSGPVALSASGLPAGATASFDPDPLSLPQSTNSTLTVTTSATTKNGSYPLRITGTSGSLTQSTSVTLQIKKR